MGDKGDYVPYFLYIMPDYLNWLATKFYIFIESSPVNDTVVSVYNIDKYTNPIMETRRKYTGKTMADALTKAYKKESASSLFTKQEE